MRYWLIKSEPSDFSINDLARKKREPWTGVRNFEARNFMRDMMRIGDEVIFYHASCGEPGAVGIARVISSAYPDPTQFDKKSAYFEPRATRKNPVWFLVDMGFAGRFDRVVTRPMLANAPALRNMRLWKSPRLSIIPLSAGEFRAILRLASYGRHDRTNLRR